MANQDNLTIAGIGSDPSGAYTPIETGWDANYADGGVKMRPTSSDVTSLVSDTGQIAYTDTKTSAVTGFTVATNDTYQIQGFPTGATILSSSLSMEVTTNSGTDSTGTFTVAGGEITSVSSSGLITFSGTGGLVPAFVGVISYTADIDEAVTTVTYDALPVLGAKNLTIYHPASGDSEVTAKFQYTDDNQLSIDGVAQETWVDLTSTTASAQAALLIDPSSNTDHAKLDKMKAIRLVLTMTDADVDGVADVSGVYEDASSGAYVGYAEDRSCESNVAVVSIGGIGADPS